MTRPEGRGDPRDVEAEIRVDDPATDRLRSEVSLADLLEDPEIYAWATQEVASEPLELPEIDPDRLAHLRARRDEILERLRQEGGVFGGG